ncbi:hypothetical protein NBRC111894_1344 [Sporolactobacillus inulinus]|uniref:Uncharacterized protein n=1 Tax=Sporolactobacillus inulinus TaxID=2078 RepID=A0A4Y1Z9T7_9BACL|nr:hypothetical protein NBRC111894_1344 [Sporolactobacillus inulinus]
MHLGKNQPENAEQSGPKGVAPLVFKTHKENKKQREIGQKYVPKNDKMDAAFCDYK